MKICALEELKELMACFPNSYINHNLELILIPKTNTYFKIEDCECHLDVKEKIITWCSRAIAKGQPYANPNKNIVFRNHNLNNLNIYLHRNFNENDIDFNPRTRVGCDRSRTDSQEKSELFQSTHPCRVRPILHLTREELGYFNPRTRVGCDPRYGLSTQIPCISIHAPV